MDRGAADVAALQDRDRAVLGPPHARLFEEAGQHVVLALGEVATRPVGALLEDDDVEPGPRQLGGGHGAARAATDHTDLATLAERGPVRAEVDAHLGATQLAFGSLRALATSSRALARGPW